MADVSRQRWFLPETPDVLGLLRGQLAVTIEGLDAFAAWAGGDPPPPRSSATRSTAATLPSERSSARFARRS